MIDLLESKVIDPELEEDLKELIELVGELGFEEHLLIDYGDELSHKDPWQLFNKKDAEHALKVARESVEISEKIYKFYFDKAR